MKAASPGHEEIDRIAYLSAKDQTPTKKHGPEKRLVTLPSIDNIDSSTSDAPVRFQRILEVPGVAILLSKGKSMSEIAEIYNVSRQAVHQFLQRNADRLSALQNGDEIIAAKIQDKLHCILEAVDTNDIKKAGLLQKFTSIGIGVEKMRLLSNKSTQNVSALTRIVCDLDDSGECPDE